MDRAYALLAAGMLGLAMAVGQAAALRELLVFACGFELAAGVVLAVWLAAGAAGSALGARLMTRQARARIGDATLSRLLAALAVLLPAMILILRAARPMLSVAPGHLPGLGQVALAGLAGMAPFCLASGALFSGAWAAASARGRPTDVYLAEALGAAAGGLGLSLGVLPYFPVLGGVVAAAWLLAGAALLGVLRGGRRPRDILAVVLSGLILAGASLGFDRLEASSRVWQWGPTVVTVADSPYENLAVTEHDGLWSVFAGGAWAFSLPERLVAEETAHPAMLAAPAPRRVLLLSQNPVGPAEEVLKYSSVERLDLVVPDPAVLPLLRSLVPPGLLAVLADPRLHLAAADPMDFVRKAGLTYDVVLIDLGEPVGAQANRFFTVEFFAAVSRLLAAGGVLGCAVPFPAEAPGPIQASRLAGVAATLKAVFPAVRVLPLSDARLLAAHRPEVLALDAGTLAKRLAERRISALYVRADSLADALEPLRQAQLAAILEQPAPVNRAFAPSAWRQGLIAAAFQARPVLAWALGRLAEAGRTWLFALAGAGAILLGLAAARRRAPAPGLAIFCVGGAQMVLAVAVLLAFQSASGALYGQLATIIAASMAGLALGAWRAGRTPSARPGRSLARIVLIHALTLGAAEPLFSLAAGMPGVTPFALLALAFGYPGGLAFVRATAVARTGAAHPAQAAGRLYALDLLGALVLSLPITLVALPLFGFAPALSGLGLVVGGAWLGLSANLGRS